MRNLLNVISNELLDFFLRVRGYCDVRNLPNRLNKCLLMHFSHAVLHSRLPSVASAKEGRVFRNFSEGGPVLRSFFINRSFIYLP